VDAAHTDILKYIWGRAGQDSKSNPGRIWALDTGRYMYMLMCTRKANI